MLTKVHLAVVVAFCCAGAVVARGAEEAVRTIEAPIDTVALFKNGLAVVTRTVEVDSAGTYRLPSVPTAVHGTFWIESDAMVSARVLMREVEVPMAGPGSDPRGELAGRRVTVRLDGEPGLELRGHVMRPGGGLDGEWSRVYETSQNGWALHSLRRSGPTIPRADAMPLVIEAESGEWHYIMPDRIASITVHDPVGTMFRRLPVLELDVEPPASPRPGPYTITMTYLAKGITWAPAYLATMHSGSGLDLKQQASIRNELEHIEDAEFLLISGFPNIEFSHVDGLASPDATLAGFFAQLNQRLGSRHATRSDVMSQVAVNVSGGGQQFDLGDLAEGTSADVHYHSIGRRGLELGAAMVVVAAEGSTGYERIVEWTITDTRDPHGRPISRNQHMGQQSMPGRHGTDDTPWDAVRFRNPLGFPMTTAPMTIMDRRRFSGQSISYWTAARELALVPITRALSVFAHHVEIEQESARAAASRFGMNGNTTRVDAEIHLANRRDEPVRMLVRRNITGELVEADLPAESRLLEHGVYAVNKRTQLVWEFDLEPNQERVIKFTYEVFVRR